MTRNPGKLVREQVRDTLNNQAASQLSALHVRAWVVTWNEVWSPVGACTSDLVRLPIEMQLDQDFTD